MRLLFLGSGGFHPNERRHTACVMLPELGLLLDAGTGAFRVHDHIATDRLDVLLTHAHLDHVVGLTYLLGLEHAGAPVDVTAYGAAATLDAVRGSLFDKRLFPLPPVERFEVLGERRRLPSSVEATTFPLRHPGGSLGIRIEHGGKSFAYVTDTTALEADTVARISGVDLLIHEAYFTEADRDFAKTTGHSTARQAAEAARDAGVGELLLVHRDPRADDDAALAEALAVFSATRCAEDGMAVRL